LHLAPNAVRRFKQRIHVRGDLCHMATVKENEAIVKSLRKELTKRLTEERRSTVEKLIYLTQMKVRLYRLLPDEIRDRAMREREGPHYAM
jgi:hypothetical protein